MRSIEDSNIGTASGPRSCNQVRRAIAVDIGCGQSNASVEVGTVGIEGGKNLQASRGDSLAANDLDLRSASGIGTDGDIGIAIAIEVRHGDKEASRKARIKGHELESLLTGPNIEDADIGAAGRSGNRDDVRDAGVVDISKRDANASG